MSNLPLPQDLKVFIAVARTASFVSAAEALGLSATTVSKRIRILEATLGIKLLHRTTRRVTVDPRKGANAPTRSPNASSATWICCSTNCPVARRAPRGLLRRVQQFRLRSQLRGRAAWRDDYKIPRRSIFALKYSTGSSIWAPRVSISMCAWAMKLRRAISRPISPRTTASCAAAPSYIARRGVPKNAGDLASHDCLVIKERDHPFGTWSFKEGDKERMVKVTGPLASNNGEIVRRWAIEGRGIILRSVWDLAPHLHTGELVHILPAIRQEANIWAVHPQRLSTSVKIRVCVEFLQQQFRRNGKEGARRLA